MDTSLTKPHQWVFIRVKWRGARARETRLFDMDWWRYALYTSSSIKMRSALCSITLDPGGKKERKRNKKKKKEKIGIQNALSGEIDASNVSFYALRGNFKATSNSTLSQQLQYSQDRRYLCDIINPDSCTFATRSKSLQIVQLLEFLLNTG